MAGLMTRKLRSLTSAPPTPISRIYGIAVKSRAVEEALKAIHDQLQREYAKSNPILYLTQVDKSNHWGLATLCFLVGINRTGEGWVC